MLMAEAPASLDGSAMPRQQSQPDDWAFLDVQGLDLDTLLQEPLSPGMLANLTAGDPLFGPQPNSQVAQGVKPESSEVGAAVATANVLPQLAPCMSWRDTPCTRL